MPVLSGAFVLPFSSLQDHTCDRRVPVDPLLHLLRLLLLQRAAGGAADFTHLLGGAHSAHGHQIPARKCKKNVFVFKNDSRGKNLFLFYPTTATEISVLIVITFFQKPNKSSEKKWSEPYDLVSKTFLCKQQNQIMQHLSLLTPQN